MKPGLSLAVFLLSALVCLSVLPSCSLARADNEEMDQLRQQVDQLRAEREQLNEELGALRQSPLVDENGRPKVVVYFGFVTQQDAYVVPVLRATERTDNLKQAAIEELIRGPGEESDLSPVLPTETRILSLEVEEGIATVDLDEKARELAGGSLGESLTIAGIVNTLAEFPDVDKVQILVNGEKGVSLGGHFVLDEPLARHERLVLQ